MGLKIWLELIEESKRRGVRIVGINNILRNFIVKIVENGLGIGGGSRIKKRFLNLFFFIFRVKEIIVCFCDEEKCFKRKFVWVKFLSRRGGWDLLNG